MECFHLPPIEDGGFRKRMGEKLANQRFPLSASMEVTLRCNMRCAHCYLGDFRSGIPNQQELSAPQIFNIFDQLAEAGLLALLLTGGDPFVRPDFLDIYAYARRKGFLVTIFTNGTQITPEIAAFLGDLPPLVMEITLYGASRETYEKVTGIPGSYDRCRRGIDLLKQHGILLRLKTMVMTLNQHELGAMQELSASLGLPFRYDALLNGQVDGRPDAFALRLSAEQVVEIDQRDPAHQGEWNRLQKKYRGAKVDSGHLYTCGAGLNSFHIDPYGVLSACMIARGSGYDLRSGSFQEAWERFLPAERARPASPGNICSQCELRAMCGQCPGWAELEHGQPGERVEYLCQITHLRQKTFKLLDF